jgi:tetratricopeptide (TPR) repeat protein
VNALWLMMLTCGASDATRADAEAAYRLGVELSGDRVAARAEFARAAAIYESLFQVGSPSPGLAFDRANAYWLAGRTDKAVLALREALQLFPTDRNLIESLRQIRERIPFPRSSPIEEAARSKPPVSPFGLLGFPALVAILFFINALACVALYRRATRWDRHWSSPLMLVAAGLALGVWLCVEHRRAADPWCVPVVVVTSGGADLHAGNSDEYPKRFDQPLPEGVELKLLGRRGGWCHVELPDGSAGWVRESATVK